MTRHVIVKFPGIDGNGQTFFARIIKAGENGFFITKEDGWLSYIARSTYKEFWTFSPTILRVINNSKILEHKEKLR